MLRNNKVLHISFGGLGNGGVTSVIMGIVSKLCSKYEFGCVVFSEKCQRELEFLKYGKLHRLNCYVSGPKIFKLLEILIRPFVMTIGTFQICKKENYGIVHCHNGRDMLFPLLGAMIAGVPKRIAHSHNTITPMKKNFFCRMYDFFSWMIINRLATDFVGCSLKACEDFFWQNSCLVINNFIDFSKFVWRREKKNNGVFIHVGRYGYQKNQEFVINVFEKIKKIKKDSVLKLVGFGRDEKRLRDVVKAKGLADSVFFIDGRHADIPIQFAESDCMIFPSLYEGFGIVLLEAQASGCYCFASDKCPSDADVGFMERLPLSLGADGWAERIVSCIGSRLNAKSEQIVAKNLKKFDVNTIVERYSELYAN